MRMALMVLVVAGMAHAADKPKESTADEQIVVTGKALSPQEAEAGEPRATLAKAEFTALLSGRQPECKNGNVSATFDHGTFASGGEKFTFDTLIKRVAELKKAGQISCFYVQSAHYDKRVYKSLEHALVDQQQISLFWPDTK